MGWEKYDTDALNEMIIPLLVLKDTIERETRMKPTALMMPVHSVPQDAVILGVPVILGDRTALIYEPPRPRTGEPT